MPPMFVSKSSRGFLVEAMMLRAARWKTIELLGDQLPDQPLVGDRPAHELGARRDDPPPGR